ncbi:hypothetical protein [Viridibacillus arvi]|uniref:hypothetical protein n=1 Tax=Viridibacillus arvi TaxID=263475 RepID=UPI0034CDC331
MFKRIISAFKKPQKQLEGTEQVLVRDCHKGGHGLLEDPLKLKNHMDKREKVSTPRQLSNNVNRAKGINNTSLSNSNSYSSITNNDIDSMTSKGSYNNDCNHSNCGSNSFSSDSGDSSCGGAD